MNTTKLTDTDLRFVVARIPEDVRKCMVNDPLWIGGGFIRETISGGEVNDIDLFSTDKERLTSVASALQKQRENSKLHFSNNANTLLSAPRTPLQFITRWTFKSPSELIESFDFTVCQAVIFYDRNSGKFDSIISESFYSDLAAKRLMYTKPIREEEAGGSMLRVLKFIKRGYNIQPHSLGNVIARVVAKVDLNTISSTKSLQSGEIIGGILLEVDPLMVVDGLDWIDEHAELNTINTGE